MTKTLALEKGKIIPATFDPMFKAVMLDPALKSVLTDIISSITGISLDTLSRLEIENPELIKDNIKNKQPRADIIVSVENNIINIEMNKYYYKWLFNKNDSYLYRLKSKTYKEDANYLDAPDLIQINFNNFDKFSGAKEIYRFRYREDDTLELDEDATVKYHVALPNIWDKCYNKPVKDLSLFERYCLILQTDDLQYAKKVAGDDVVMKKLVDKIEKISTDDWLSGIYDPIEEEVKIKRTMIRGAQLEGIEQGKKEMIQSMYENNYSIEEISKIANLSLEEVKKVLEV